MSINSFHARNRRFSLLKTLLWPRTEMLETGSDYKSDKSLLDRRQVFSSSLPLLVSHFKSQNVR